jgi:Arm DNA-binding domain
LSISKDALSKRWTFLYTLNGKQREMGLGPFARVTVAEARAKARRLRSMLAGGVDPLDAKQTRGGDA